MIGTTETSQKMLQTYSNSTCYENSKTCKDFEKALEFKTRGTTAAVKPEKATTTIKSNDKGINYHNITSETYLH